MHMSRLLEVTSWSSGSMCSSCCQVIGLLRPCPALFLISSTLLWLCCETQQILQQHRWMYGEVIPWSSGSASCFSSHKRAESSHAAGSMAFYSSFLWSFLWSVASICQIPPFLQVVLLLPLWCTCCHFHLHQSTWRFLLPNWTDWHPWSLADFECYLHFNSIWLVWFRKTIFVSCYLLKGLKHNPS